MKNIIKTVYLAIAGHEAFFFPQHFFSNRISLLSFYSILLLLFFRYCVRCVLYFFLSFLLPLFFSCSVLLFLNLTICNHFLFCIYRLVFWHSHIWIFLFLPSPCLQRLFCICLSLLLCTFLLLHLLHSFLSFPCLSE